MRPIATLLLACLVTLDATASAYYRDPDLREGTLVFTAEGDLWLANVDGGNARRLTTHPADETQARLSPDGRLVAFRAAYDERAQVHVIPVNGGVARQLTFENGSIKVHGWTPDGRVIYSSNGQIGTYLTYQLRSVDAQSLDNQPYPLADAVEGTVDSSSETLYFVQFGMQVSGDNVRAYRGGARGVLWRFDLNSDKEAQRLLADHEGSIRRPMLDGDTLYFISDASGVENLWATDTAGGAARQITRHEDWSIRGIDIDNGQAIYQLGADLVRLDLASGESTVLPISLTSDFPALRDRWLPNPLKFATAFKLNAAGDRLSITARGEAALASADKRRLVEVALPEASRIRGAALGPDGDWVYGMSDASGEVELWRFAADGSSRAEQLTEDGETFRWNFALSPDGRWIAHADNAGRIWLLDLRSGRNTPIIEDGAGLGPAYSLAWSPDSTLLALSYEPRDMNRAQLTLYSIDRRKSQAISSGRFDTYDPTFSQDGKWLYFLSERTFTPFPSSPWGDRNMGTAFDRRVGLYAVALTKAASFPFADPTELTPAAADEDKESSKEGAEAQEPEPVTIDWDGINQRLWQLPLPAGNYARLAAGADRLYFLDLTRGPDAAPSLQSIAYEPQPKPAVFADGVADFSLSADGKKLFLRQQGDGNNKLFIVGAAEKFPEDPQGTEVQTAVWRPQINPQEEWRQMFYDAWLMHRDFFFDPNMRGLDWQATEAKYRPLLDRLRDRRDLDDVLAQMMGELGALHSSVGRGDYRKDDNGPRYASLGARLSEGPNGVTVEQIYRHDAELPATASPLARPGVDAQDGDTLRAINGVSVSTLAEVGAALRNQADQQVLLELERGRKSHSVVIKPASAGEDRRLRYRDWALAKENTVRAANPDIGYLHLNAMGGADIGSFARDFYVNNRKAGLIIDVRRNGGGNVDSLLIEKLMRRAWSFWIDRNGTLPGTNMQGAFRGHLVVLADQFTYSDGETFTAGVQSLGMATVIGKQTAGAGVWLRGINNLVDRGRARVSEFPVYAMDGRWINEGTGVAPNIEIDNPPYATFRGEDAQLQAAIAYLERKIREEPLPPLKAKPFPSGTKPADEIMGR
ncbi:MAG: S41 family peptidase [Pseudomonadota bacterium]